MAHADSTRPQAILPEGWPRPKGYANGVLAQGRMLFIAGMIGWDGDGRFHTDDFAGQVRQALQNVADVLKEAGGTGENIVRMTWYVTDIEAYRKSLPAIGAAYRELIGKNFPAMAVVGVTALVEPKAKIEIETIAVVPE